MRIVRFVRFQLLAAAALSAALSCSKEVTDTTPQEAAAVSKVMRGDLVSDSLIKSVSVKEAAIGLLGIITDSGQFSDSTVTLIGNLMGMVDPNLAEMELKYYRITYWSKDNRGRDILLNGDIAFMHNPSESSVKALESVSLFHTALFTCSERATNYEDLMLPVRAIHNALVVHPLYQGAGIDKGNNDIAISEQLLKARQAIDCELAALKFIRKTGIVEMAPGYRTDNISLSVGSGTALATHYLLEQDSFYSAANDSEIHLAGTCLCEGCYSFRSILSQFITSDYEYKDGYDIGAYCLIASIVGSYDTWNGIDKGDGSCFFDGYSIEDFFSEAFLATEARDSRGQQLGKSIIDYYRSGDMNHFKSWPYKNLNTLNMLSPEMYAPDGSIDESCPKSAALLEALGQNDIVTSGWYPEADMCFCHSLDDELIPFEHVYNIYNSLSRYGLNRNVRMNTIRKVSHDDGNTLFAVTHYLLRNNPVR